jgi:hypothetical protein
MIRALALGPLTTVIPLPPPLPNAIRRAFLLLTFLPAFSCFSRFFFLLFRLGSARPRSPRFRQSKEPNNSCSCSLPLSLSLSLSRSPYTRASALPFDSVARCSWLPIAPGCRPDFSLDLGFSHSVPAATL